jgi:sortase A
MSVASSFSTWQPTVIWSRRVLFLGAALTLGYCGFVMADTWAFQYRENKRLEHLLRAPSAPGSPAIIMTNGLIGRIEVPRLGVSVVVIEGTGTATLRRAAGHIPGTALPGQPGNTGVSAHRDTFFRPLKDIRVADSITVTTLSGEFRYKVVSTKIVNPGDVEVLKAGTDQILTLVTCYPFYYVGAAPQRFVVRAERDF